jgi:lysophospholipase L1-like esterase
VFVAYPDKTELTKKIDNNETLQVWSKLKSSRYPMLDVANHPAWKETLYYDGIHPSAKGNEVLGHIINDFLNYQL